MPSATQHADRVIFIVLRFMRTPIMVLVGVYAVSMVGWVMIPAVDEDGNAKALSFFHAFYFLTYTATTTGFGEIPYPFSDAQRMWGIVSLYSSVIAWLYAIGAIIRLVQNPHFQQAVAERRFANGVERISEPFYILCGFGNTGSLLTRGLTDAGMTVVILDRDPERIKALALRNYRTSTPGVCADARVPARLLEAGLCMTNCRGVVALTHDEEVNLKIAVTTRLLRPDARVVIKSTSPEYEAVLAALGGDIHIVDPFQTYARYLGATLDDPSIHSLSQWLSGSPGARLDSPLEVPRKGHWILCGYGRMGRRLDESLQAVGISTTIIEREPDEQQGQRPGYIAGAANPDTLTEAGIDEAAGIVAGTASDSANLSILVTARASNPQLFAVVRQNQHYNQTVFDAARADLIMQPSLVSARRILFLLTAPLLKSFFEDLRAADGGRTGERCADVIGTLRDTVGGSAPRVWTVEVNRSGASALLDELEAGLEVRLADLLRDPNARAESLACVPLVVRSEDEVRVMPDLSVPLSPGDEILFCGSPRAVRLLDATLNNAYTLRYLVTGLDEPRGYVMSWIAEKRAARCAVPQTAEPS